MSQGRLSPFKWLAQSYYLAAGWGSLAKSGRSQAVQRSWIWLFITPAAAKLLSLTPEVVCLPFTEPCLPLNLVLPFTWQLLFLAALAFSIGSAVFNLRCPWIFKNFRDYAAFTTSGGDRHLLTSLLMSLIHDHPELEDQITMELQNGLSSSDAMRPILGLMRLREPTVLFRAARYASAHLCPYSRAATFIAFASGMLLLALVIVQNCLVVIQTWL